MCACMMVSFTLPIIIWLFRQLYTDGCSSWASKIERERNRKSKRRRRAEGDEKQKCLRLAKKKRWIFHVISWDKRKYIYEIKTFSTTSFTKLIFNVCRQQNLVIWRIQHIRFKIYYSKHLDDSNNEIWWNYGFDMATNIKYIHNRTCTFLFTCNLCERKKPHKDDLILVFACVWCLFSAFLFFFVLFFVFLLN